MKTTIAPICLVLSLALGFSTPAVADHGRHGGYRGGHYGGHYAAQPYHHHPGHYRQDRWVAPAAVLALTGIVAGVAAATYYSPPPVYVAPPPVYVAPPPRPIYVVPAQPLYAPAPGRYWGY
ncbi:MAG: hypothetical protein J0M13_10840 [Candidatus Accumulibacter sp.]|jgi:hypothetical protein|nr:hypothetical protein [Candidatus Accumulibacter necessarius]